MSTEEQNNIERVDALSAISRVNLRDEKPAFARRLFPVLLLLVFFAALLLALISGVSVYKSVTNSQARNASRREGLDLVLNVVRANDAKDCVAVGEGPEGRSLVVVENLESGTFETRIYLYEGNIVEEYSVAGSPYTPEKASVICESSTFEFSYGHGLLAIKTSQGTGEIALRNMQGGE